jgi:hypothetical protein
MQESGAPGWRELIGKHHSAMVDEISDRLDSEVRTAIALERSQQNLHLARARDDARRSHAEQLNLALRRLREAHTEEQVLQHLAESCSRHASRVVVLVFENNQGRAVATKGIPETHTSLAFSLTDAPALVSVVETRDPVVAIASPAEISTALAAAFNTDISDSEPDKAYLFPVVARQSVVGILAVAGAAYPAPLELLCGTAAMRIEALYPQAALYPQNAGSPPVSEKAAWEDLSQDEQRVHLQAQRMARVRVAEMRLYHEDALRQGTGARDIYSALKAPVDAARQAFLQTYLSASPTMVDYLHLEIVKSLAHDDDRLLGPDYPGPMV